jgi:adenylate cyclase
MMQMLQQTSSRSIATKFLQSGKGDLGGGIAHSTVMFCDIRGFTNISEKLGAPNVVSLLNEYFSFMEDVIASEGGAVDKYIGDAIMAIFGVPESTGDDARRACRAAQRMLAALDIFNAGRAEQERLAIGIGLATGEVIAGNIGSPSRLNYTVIGDTVNMASRLEALTKVYGTDILICEKTRAGLGDDFPLREIDRVKVRGQKMPITLFEVVTRDPATMPAEWLSAYQAGRTAYEAGKFTEALDQFTIARRSRIDDRASALLVERCRLLATALPPKWDGVWQME